MQGYKFLNSQQSKMFMKIPKAANSYVSLLIFASFLVSIIVWCYLADIYGFSGFIYLPSASFLGTFHRSNLTSSSISSDLNNSTTVTETDLAPSPSGVCKYEDEVEEKKNEKAGQQQREDEDFSTIDNTTHIPSTSSYKRGNETVGKKNVALTGKGPCLGKYIFIQELPRKFNYELLDNCETLSYQLKDMCVYLQNNGFGPRIFENSTREGDFKADSWFATDQFTLEPIFHSRMRQYECLTNESSKANAIFVPFYAALEAGRNIEGLNMTVMDKMPIELMNYISSLKEWKVVNGRDHFFVAGRISWDFRRFNDRDGEWGNKLMYLPQAKNITMLTIESTTYHKNEVGIPYATYFHPTSSDEVRQWQNSVAQRERRYLFAFAGAPRPWQNSIRNELISQCEAATDDCVLISCKDMTDKKCHNPLNVLKLSRNSVFCLEPPGDSPTRRATFDAIISGCIPVFFDLKSGPDQYIWHFPRNYSQYSVYIPQEDIKANKTDVRKVLSSIPAEKVRQMRSEVIKMIPQVIYTDRRGGSGEMEKDSFDIALQGILNRVENIKKEFYGGKDSGLYF